MVITLKDLPADVETEIAEVERKELMAKKPKLTTKKEKVKLDQLPEIVNLASLVNPAVTNSMLVVMQLASPVKRVVQAIREPLARTEVEATQDAAEAVEAAVAVTTKTPKETVTTVKLTEAAVAKITATEVVKETAEQEVLVAVKETEVMLKETEAAAEAVVVEMLSVKVNHVLLVIILLVRTIAPLVRTETAVAAKATIKLPKKATPVVETKVVKALVAAKIVVKEETDLLVVELKPRKALLPKTEQSHSSTLGDLASRTTLKLETLSFLACPKPRA